MGLQTEGPPDPADRRLGHARRLGHRPRRPVRRVIGFLLQRLHDDDLHRIIGDGARRTRSGLVDQPIESRGDEPAPPLADSRLGHTQTCGYFTIGRPLGTGQHDLRTQSKRLRTLRPARPSLEYLSLVVSEYQRLLRASESRHVHLHGHMPERAPQARNSPSGDISYELATQDTRSEGGNYLQPCGWSGNHGREVMTRAP